MRRLLLAGPRNATLSLQARKQLTDVRQPCQTSRRPLLAGCWIDDGYAKDHRCAPDEVIRPLSVIAAPRSPKV